MAADPTACGSTGNTIGLIPQVISGTPEPQVTPGLEGEPGPTGPAGMPFLVRALTTVGAPTDPIHLLWTIAETTIAKFILVANGDVGSDVTVQLYTSPTANGVGTPLFAVAVTSDAPATGNIYPDDQAFIDSPPVVDAGDYIWATISGTTGTVTSVFMQLVYQQPFVA